MTNPTPYWREAEWRNRHGFESIQGPVWRKPVMTHDPGLVWVENPTTGQVIVLGLP